MLEFVGIPYLDRGRDRAGVDCWGLVRLFFAGRGIALPDYLSDYGTADDRVGVAIAIGPHSTGWQRVDAPRYGDCVLFNIAGAPCHIGIVLERGRFLHSMRGRNSCVEDLDAIQWARRIEGFYRWD